VSVGDVQRADAGEFLHEGVDHLPVVDNPETVADAVRRHEIVFRFFPADFLDDLIDRLGGAVREEYRAGVRVVTLTCFVRSSSLSFRVSSCFFIVLFRYSLTRRST